MAVGEAKFSKIDPGRSVNQVTRSFEYSTWSVHPTAVCQFKLMPPKESN